MSEKKITSPKLKLNDGNEIPVLGLGTFLGRSEEGTVVTPEDDTLTKVVEYSIEVGYRHIDTAAVYETEEQVGRAVRNKIEDGTIKRKDIFITTKLWSTKHAREDVVPALKASLSKLGLDYIDLYLIHTPMALSATFEAQNIDYLDTWKGMEEAKRLGLTKSIGISNFNEEQIERLFANSEIKPAVLQVEVNLSLAQTKLLSLARDKGMAVTAYTPFSSMFGWRARVNPDAPPPKHDDPALVAIANKYGKSTLQVVLRHLLDRDLIVIPKSTSPARILQNIDVFDFELSSVDTAVLEGFNKDYRSVPLEYFQNHPHYPFKKNSSK